MIEIIKVKDREEGNIKAHKILVEITDNNTLLALSGGTSPNYRKMIVEPLTPLRSEEQSYEGQGILPGAVCMVDERFGTPLHKNSNELMFEESGLIGYFFNKRIKFYKILKGETFVKTANSYNMIIARLFGKFPKKIGIMGIGKDLHTAGLFPNSEADHSPHYVVYETVEDEFPQRISLSLKALGEFDNFIILVFGSAKQNVLKKLLDENENDMQKAPAIFYRKCKAKSYLITDQEIK